jgi:predicted DNA binding CopG/RHH family protein
MKKKLKKVPKFKNEDDKRKFWAKVDSTDYINWSEVEIVALPKLKPSTKTISLRLPESMLNEIRTIANKHDVPYQSFIKIILKEKIDEELKKPA